MNNFEKLKKAIKSQFLNNNFQEIFKTEVKLAKAIKLSNPPKKDCK